MVFLTWVWVSRQSRAGVGVPLPLQTPGAPGPAGPPGAVGVPGLPAGAPGLGSPGRAGDDPRPSSIVPVQPTDRMRAIRPPAAVRRTIALGPPRTYLAAAPGTQG